MARIAGITLPNEKRVQIGLTYIFGIGHALADQILKETGVNPDTRVKNLTEQQVNKLREAIEKKYKVEGAKVVLVSTSLEPIVKAIADYLDVNDYIATKLKLENSLYTGLVEGSVVTGDKKLELVKHLLSTYEHTNIETYFYSDHLSDIDLLNFVDNPYVVNPSKILYNKAVRKNWGIINIK